MTDHALVLRSGAAEATRAVAGVVATALRPGDVVALSGELGAGKTCFVQGATRALGFTGRVTSPTFTLVRQYPASLPVVHVDVYRLDRIADVLELGEDVLADDVVTLVEWGDTIATLLPADRLDVEVVLADPTDVDADRLVRLTPRGDWGPRLAALHAALAPWRTGVAEPDGAGAEPRPTGGAGC